MAPAPEVLKRKRSRPSEWWAAAPNPAPPQPALLSQKQRVLLERTIQEVPAAGNRGKTKEKDADGGSRSKRKKDNMETPRWEGKEHLDNAQDELRSTNSVESAVQSVTTKKGRSSAGNSRARGAIEILVTDRAEQSKRRRASTRGVDKENGIRKHDAQPAETKKKGQRFSSQSDQTDATKGSGERHNALESQSTRPPILQTEDEHTAPARSKRKPQSSNAEDELLPAAKPVSIDPVSSRKRRSEWSERNHKSDDDKGRGEKPVRRGRSSNIEAEVQAIFNEATRIQRRSKKVLKPQNSQGTSKSSVSSTQKEPPHNRRTRQSDPSAEISTVENSNNEFTQPPSRGRRSTAILAVETAAPALANDWPKTRKLEGVVRSAEPTVAASAATSRSKTNKPVDSSSRTLGSSRSRAQGKNSRQESNNRALFRKRKETKEPNSDLQAAKRRRVERPHELGEHEISEPDKIPEYQHLTAVTTRVSRQTIERKWEPLPPGIVELISQFLHDLQRPVIVRLNDERRRTQASTALQMVSRRLVSKISKGLPFPGSHSSQEDDFNFEKILDRNRVLEAQLTPALHANELLEAELIRETALLESEQTILAELETNAKTESTIRKQAGRTLHPLLQLEEAATPKLRLTDRIGLEDGHQYVSVSLDTHGDENLQEIFAQINGHAHSIQGNMNQVQGITEAVLKGKAAVQATLFDHLEEGQYAGIILGEVNSE